MFSRVLRCSEMNRDLRLAVLGSLSAVVLACSPMEAADWPMWRADARRSGSVSEPLPEELHLRWVRSLPARRVAWPNEARLQFDLSYEPIVLGQRLFVASSTDGSLSAFDTQSGERLWQFFSEGPIRLAPVGWKDRVLFGSDDGYLYCIEAQTGSLLWKVRGAPADRPDYRHLGNTRLVSYWPVRGGPVLEENDQGGATVYFAAGIWPTLGIFVHAVDAESGTIRWTNSNTNYIQNVRIDHNALDDVGLSPQGHGLIAGGWLVMPNGRSMPARFDRETGQLQHYVQGYRNGDSRVAAGGSFLFVGERGVVNLADGREVGNRWVEAGAEAPQGWNGAKRDLFEGPFYGYKFIAGCDYRSVFDDPVAWGVAQGRLYSYDLTQPRKSTYEKKVGTQVLHPARWILETVWPPVRLDQAADQPTRVTIKAGNRLYTHVGRKLLAVEVPSHDPENKTPAAKPRIAWSKELDAMPSSLIAADDKLFVVLEDGRLCCYGSDPSKVKSFPLPRTELSNEARETARTLVEASGIRDGYALVLGLDAGQLVDALLQETDLHIIAVDADAEKVRRLRSHWVQSGLYGRRVELFQGNPETFQFPPYLGSLILSERSGTEHGLSGIPFGKLVSLLRPYGGTAVIPETMDDDWKRWTREASGIEDVTTLGHHQGLVVLRRPEAPAGAADWTHETGDAARSYFSPDQRVKSPLALLWYGDGPDHGFAKWKDYGRGVKPQVVRGRLFAFDDKAQQLTAIDIYTGRLLWRHKTETSIVRFVSMPEGIYVAQGLNCQVLDPATGRVRTTFRCEIDVAEGKTPGTVAVRATEDFLLIGIGFDLPGGHSHPAIESGLWDARVLVAFDPQTGEQLWTRTAAQRFNLHAIAIGTSGVFCVDSIAPLEADQLKRRGQAPETFPSRVIALEKTSGQELWTKTFSYGYRAMTGRGPLAIRPYDDWIAYNAAHHLVLCGKLHEIHALYAGSGEEVWQSPSAGMQPLILSEDSYINQAGHRFDVTNGKRLSSEPLFRRTGGCNYTVGNRNLLFLRAKCATYVDLEDQESHSLRNLRSGCSNSLVAAGGLLNVPCFSTGCVCNYPLQTSFAMYHLPEAETWSGEKPLALPSD